MEMRDAFRQDEAGRQLFIEEAKARHLRFHPDFSGELFGQPDAPSLIYDGRSTTLQRILFNDDNILCLAILLETNKILASFPRTRRFNAFVSQAA